MLTLQEFPDAEHVETAYMFIPELVANGELDTGGFPYVNNDPGQYN
ncbi:hypothetical protein [Microbacterium aurum]